MEHNIDLLGKALDQSFANTAHVSALQWLMRPMLGLLTRGRPVTLEQLAIATGRDVAQVEDAVLALPNVEMDGLGRIVGWGLTLNETPHCFFVNGCRLHTWCALDTLMFPAVLGKSVRVESPCGATGILVRLHVDPHGITDVDPPSSVVSIVTPADVSAVRASFCTHVHFFVSADAASGWLADHVDGTVVSTGDAFELGQRLAAARFTETNEKPCC